MTRHLRHHGQTPASPHPVDSSSPRTHNSPTSLTGGAHHSLKSAQFSFAFVPLLEARHPSRLVPAPGRPTHPPHTVLNSSLSALRLPTCPKHRPRPPGCLKFRPGFPACPTCRALPLRSRTMSGKNCSCVRCPPTCSSFRPMDSQNPNDEPQGTPKRSATAQIPALSLICS